MEKKINLKKIVILCLCVIILCATFMVIYFVGFKNNNTVVTELNITKNTIILNKGQSVDLKDYYTTKPINFSANVMCLSGNSGLATINGENVLTAKDVGETKLYLKVSSGDKTLQQEIVLKIYEQLTIPTKLSFRAKNISLLKTDKNVKNELTITGNFNVTPKVEYSNSNVCEYNVETGLITPKQIGTTTITVKFSNNEKEISESFVVEVKNEINKEIVLEATNLIKTNDNYSITIDCGNDKNINISYFEDGNETDFEFNVEILVNNCGIDYATDRNRIIICSENKGTAVIKIEIVGKDKFILLNIEGE